MNKKIDEEKPWVLAKNGETEKLNKCLTEMMLELRQVAVELSPFIPTTSERILEIFVGEVYPPEAPLFPKQ